MGRKMPRVKEPATAAPVAAMTKPKVVLRIKIRPSNSVRAGSKETVPPPSGTTETQNDAAPQQAVPLLEHPGASLKRKRAASTQSEMEPHQQESDHARKQIKIKGSRPVIIDSDSDSDSDGHSDNDSHTDDRRSDQYPKVPTTPISASSSASTGSLTNIIETLTTFPTGEVAYGTELANMPLPDLEILNQGVVQHPYDKNQLRPVKKFANDLRAKRFGINWKAAKRTPTWCVIQKLF